MNKTPGKFKIATVKENRNTFQRKKNAHEMSLNMVKDNHDDIYYIIDLVPIVQDKFEVK